jgi:hypothetical protein
MVRFRSIRLNALSTSPSRGPPATTASLTVATAAASGQGCRLLFAKSIGHTGPTSVHNRYIVVKYYGTHKNDIYKKKIKI